MNALLTAGTASGPEVTGGCGSLARLNVPTEKSAEPPPQVGAAGKPPGGMGGIPGVYACLVPSGSRR